MRTSLSIDDETFAIVEEAAKAQNRTTAGQLRHLIKSHPEIVGWKLWEKRLEAEVIMAAVRAETK